MNTKNAFTFFTHTISNLKRCISELLAKEIIKKELESEEPIFLYHLLLFIRN